MITHNVKNHTDFKYHLLSMPNYWHDKTLLLSKVSEALHPDMPDNHIGAGGTFNDILKVQSNILLLMSAGFNHYRKDFYDWPHANFNEGDPVGLVKIRQHVYADQLNPAAYGYFVQKNKKEPWEILRTINNANEYKYVLGCTPLLIFNNVPTDLTQIEDEPVEIGKINPPSYLGHKDQKHPRALVGIRGEELVFIVAEAPGCTLQEMQKIALNENLEHALNLDGGGSAKFMLAKENGSWIKSNSPLEDENRILGHVFIVFNN